MARCADSWRLLGRVIRRRDHDVSIAQAARAGADGDVALWTRSRLATRPSLDELFSKVRDKKARDQRIHAATRVHEYTLQAVADFLGLHYSTISMIAKRIAESEKHQE